MSLKEVLQIADALAREKGIEREEVVVALEEAIQKLASQKYGVDNDIRAVIDRKTGDIQITRHREIVENAEDIAKHIDLKEAQKKNPYGTVGDFVIDALPPIDFGRTEAYTARHVVSQRVKEAERRRLYDEFKDRVGEIIGGVIKRVEYGNYIIDLGQTEGVLRREESIPRENLRVGDRVRSYIMDIKEGGSGPQVMLSRCHPHFMAKLFEQEVPEIQNGTIQIISVARDPGSRAKIAVHSKDSTLDPVGSCVGIRGSRVQVVTNELQGEKVDIIVWTPDIPTLVINALAPAEITKVIYDETARRIEAVVAQDQLSLAIGRRGQNVRLAGLLTGLHVSIISEADESMRRNEEVKRYVQTFAEALDVDEMIAHLLAAEGYVSVKEIADSPLEELSSIEGFEEDLALALKERAQSFWDAHLEKIHEKLSAYEIEGALRDLLPDDILLALAQKKIVTLDDFANLSNDELQEIVGDGLTQQEVNDLIMAARASWFKD